MMNFDKQQFNKYHGWIRLYPLLAICGWLFITIIVNNISSFRRENDVFDIIIVGIPILLIIGSSITAVGLCVELHLNAKKQTQQFQNSGMIEIHLVRDVIYPFYAYGNSTKDWGYIVKNIDSISALRVHILICGTIERDIYYPNTWFKKNQHKRKTVSKVYIPRNFTNEDLILKMDIDKYNATMRRLEK